MAWLPPQQPTDAGALARPDELSLRRFLGNAGFSAPSQQSPLAMFGANPLQGVAPSEVQAAQAARRESSAQPVRPAPIAAPVAQAQGLPGVLAAPQQSAQPAPLREAVERYKAMQKEREAYEAFLNTPHTYRELAMIRQILPTPHYQSPAEVAGMAMLDLVKARKMSREQDALAALQKTYYEDQRPAAQARALDAYRKAAISSNDIFLKELAGIDKLIPGFSALQGVMDQ